MIFLAAKIKQAETFCFFSLLEESSKKYEKERHSQFMKLMQKKCRIKLPKM